MKYTMKGLMREREVARAKVLEDFDKATCHVGNPIDAKLFAEFSDEMNSSTVDEVATRNVYTKVMRILKRYSNIDT